MNIQSEMMNAHENGPPWLQHYVYFFHSPWVIPPSNTSSLNKPSQLTLTHDSVHEVHPSKGLNANATKSQGALNPSKLSVTVIVLGCTQCMSYTLNGIDYGTCKVVGRVGLVLCSRTVVRRCVLAIQNWITQCLHECEKY